MRYKTKKHFYLDASKPIPGAILSDFPFANCVDAIGYNNRCAIPYTEFVKLITPGSLEIEIYGNFISLMSMRMQSMLRNPPWCANEECGAQIQYAVVQCAINGVSPNRDKTRLCHVNFYGTDPYGEWRMFTCDHVLARALGGSNDLSNTQTLCRKCNGEKSKWEGFAYAQIHTWKKELESLRMTPEEMRNMSYVR